MATFEAKKLELTQVNGGQEYEQGDFLQSDTINDVVGGTAYAQNVAEEANTTSNKAVSTANSANKTANAASAKVDTFEQRITTAQNTADTAVSNAATAQSTADNATTEINKIKNGTTVVPNANHANNADNANLATKAQQDVNGKPINTTYATVEYVDDLVTEKQGTRVTVNNVNVAELSFTSDPQTQISDIVSGAQTVGKAKQDANGNVIDTTYAKLAQVVRTDAAQTLNDGQKQIARNNITTFISKGLPSAGWYRIAELNTSGFFEITFNSVNYSIAPSPCKVFISYGYTTTGNCSLTSINANSVSSNVKSVRLILVENKRYVDFYYNGTTSRNIVGIVMSGISYNTAFAQITPIDFTPVDDTGTILTSLDITAGINTTGGISQNGAPVFATDTSALTPSTANGWTQTTTTGTLPSAGTYYVFPSTTSGVGIIGTAIVVFDGTNNAFGATGGLEVVNVFYAHSNEPDKWVIAYAGGEKITTDYILYKRIN